MDENIDLLETNAGQKEKICAEAEILLKDAGDNIFQQSDAISIICQNFIELKDPASADLFFKYVSKKFKICLLYTSPSPRDRTRSRMPYSA